MGQTYGCTTILSVYTIQLLHIQFPTVGVPLHPLHHRLLTVRLQLVVLKLGGSRPAVAGPRGRRP